MSCIGVLYKSKASNNPNPGDAVMADFQVNYWKLPKKHWGYNRFLDLGVLVYDAQDLESILFYVPFKLKEDDLSDLGDILVKEDLLGTLFNEPYIIENAPQSPGYHYDSTSRQDEPRPGFWIYSLTRTNFKVTPLSVGSLIEVTFKTKPTPREDIKSTDENKDGRLNLYFRFRINNVLKNSLSHIESVSNDFFQSVFSKTEMMNLHINTIGEIDDDDYKNLASKYSFVNFYKIHFFFVASSEEEAIKGTTNYTDSRLLDSPKWKHYVGDRNPQNRKCLAYHWKLRGTFDRGNFFFRTIYSSANLLKILKYSVVILVLGIMSSYCASILPQACSSANTNECTCVEKGDTTSTDKTSGSIAIDNKDK